MMGISARAHIIFTFGSLTEDAFGRRRLIFGQKHASIKSTFINNSEIDVQFA